MIEPEKKIKIESSGDKTTPGKPEKPLSLGGAIINNLRELHQDESSGINVSEVSERIANSALGNKIAPGLFVSELGSVPRFHLLDTPTKSTFRDFERTQNALLDCITRHQRIEGVTPSKNALRVMVLMLRNLPDISHEDSRLLHKICNEAKNLDLNEPENAEWKREHTIKIKDSLMRIQLSLLKNDTATQLLTKMLGTDIPKEDRGNKYSYRLNFSKSIPDKTQTLQGVESLLRRTYAVGLAVIPSMTAGWLTLQLMPSKFQPLLSKINSLQTFTEFSVGAASLFTVMYGAYHLINYSLQKNRHK